MKFMTHYEKKWRRAGVALLIPLLSISISQITLAQRHEGGAGRAEAPRTQAPMREAPQSHMAPAGRTVERQYHGSIGHANVGTVPRANFNVHRNFDAEVNHGYGHFEGRRPRGFVLPVLPFGYSTFYIGGVPYYYSDGDYYQQGPSGYTVVAPPDGAVMGGIPSGSIPIDVNGETWYYLDGTFYEPQGSGYGVVAAPMGVMVPELPSGAAQVDLNGNVYYQYGGVYYQPVMQNGVTMYVTVAPPQ